MCLGCSQATYVEQPIVTHQVTDDVLYINGVVDYVSTTKSFAVIGIPTHHKLFKLFDYKLFFWITAYNQQHLLSNVEVGKRYTFKVILSVANVELKKNNVYQYSIWCQLIEVL